MKNTYIVYIQYMLGCDKLFLICCANFVFLFLILLKLVCLYEPSQFNSLSTFIKPHTPFVVSVLMSGPNNRNLWNSQVIKESLSETLHSEALLDIFTSENTRRFFGLLHCLQTAATFHWVRKNGKRRDNSTRLGRSSRWYT